MESTTHAKGFCLKNSCPILAMQSKLDEMKGKQNEKNREREIKRNINKKR